MGIKKITKKLYTIDVHPNVKDVYDLNRYKLTWDLVEHTFQEFYTSMNKLLHVLQATGYDWDTRYPKFNIREEHKEKLEDLYLRRYELPLTGCYTDEAIIEAVCSGDMSIFRKAIDKATDFVESDEYIYNVCMANDYYFYEDGTMYNER